MVAESTNAAEYFRWVLVFAAALNCGLYVWMVRFHGSRVKVRPMRIAASWTFVLLAGWSIQNAYGRVAAIQRGDPLTWQDFVWLGLHIAGFSLAVYIVKAWSSYRKEEA